MNKCRREKVMYKRKIAIMTLIGIMTLLSGCSAKEEEQFTKTMLSVEQKTEESIQIVEEDDSYSGQKLAFGDYLILLEKAEIGEKTKGFRLTYSISGKEKSQACFRTWRHHRAGYRRRVGICQGSHHQDGR